MLSMKNTKNLLLVNPNLLKITNVTEIVREFLSKALKINTYAEICVQRDLSKKAQEAYDIIINKQIPQKTFKEFSSQENLEKIKENIQRKPKIASTTNNNEK